jgi:hypothetical protein
MKAFPASHSHSTFSKVILWNLFRFSPVNHCKSRDSAVDIASGYGLDDRGHISMFVFHFVQDLRFTFSGVVSWDVTPCVVITFRRKALPPFAG